jgi:regulator of RNase E activity RraA
MQIIETMKREWTTDSEMLALGRHELFSAVLGDVMDKMGLLRQFLPPQIQPLVPEMVVAGRAMTVLEADFFEEAGPGTRNAVTAMPFGLMLEALDDLKQDEVYLCTGGSPRYALWGELMSTRAIRCGAAGAVVDGYSRDTKGVLALNFPTFSRGRYAQDQGPRGRWWTSGFRSSWVECGWNRAISCSGIWTGCASCRGRREKKCS